MHWSLLREMVHNELGGDPEQFFAEFDRQAFAAASLGQVHRARLKTGEVVAEVTLPLEMTVWEVGEDYLLGTVPNADGVYGVLKYGLQRGTH